MKFKDALGIDISKNTIDVHLWSNDSYRQFSNSLKGFKSLLLWSQKKPNLKLHEVIICFENTGLYSLHLATFFSNENITFYMINPLEIYRSLGIVRGKNDKVDAKRIAEYAFLRKDSLKPFTLPSNNILKLQRLLTIREKLVKQRSGYLTESKEYTPILKKAEYVTLFAVTDKMIHYLSKQIKTVELEIKHLIECDLKMAELYHLITSVKGVGFVLATHLLVATNCFSSFKDGRKFACYAGIAPFEKQSGISLKTKGQVSHYANKKLKTLLNLAAFSAVQFNPEMKLYYQRRLKQNKSKMSSINIVRNKIVHRVFAVVKRGTPYVPLHNFAA